MAPTPSPLLTVRQVAQRLAVDDSTVRRLIQRGNLPAVKVGGVRVRPEELEAFIEASRITPPQPAPTPTRATKPAVSQGDWRAEYEALTGRRI